MLPKQGHSAVQELESFPQPVRPSLPDGSAGEPSAGPSQTKEHRGGPEPESQGYKARGYCNTRENDTVVDGNRRVEAVSARCERPSA